MTLEHRTQPITSPLIFLLRMLRRFAIVSIILVFSLGLGTVGYHAAEGLPWLDALLNAAMILTGMGPVDRIQSTSGKLFAVFYALYSGIVFLSSVAIIFGPIMHRVLHHLHLEVTESESSKPKRKSVR